MLELLFVGMASALLAIAAILIGLRLVGAKLILRPTGQELKTTTAASARDGAGDEESYPRKIVALKPEDHDEIWNDFIGQYYAINPPFVVDLNDKSMAAHAERYRGGRCRALYVFYSNSNGKSHYRDAMKNAAFFWDQMNRFEPGSANAVSVVVSDAPPPNYTLFIGRKRVEGHTATELVSIIYISEPPFTHEKGMPIWAFLCYDQRLNDIIWYECERLAAEHRTRRVSALTFAAEVLGGKEREPGMEPASR